jgi:hypothetical protein
MCYKELLRRQAFKVRVSADEQLPGHGRFRLDSLEREEAESGGTCSHGFSVPMDFPNP